MAVNLFHITNQMKYYCREENIWSMIVFVITCVKC